MSAFPVGRHVTGWGCPAGTIEAWEPLSHAMTDTLVRLNDGSVCWFALHTLKPIDGGPELPSRKEAIERARIEQVSALRAIRAGLIRDWHQPWPGAEHGKAIIGRAIDGALAAIAGRE